MINITTKFVNNLQEDDDDFDQQSPLFISDDADEIESRGGFRRYRPSFAALKKNQQQQQLVANQLAADQRLFGLLGGGGITITTTSSSSGIFPTKTVAKLINTLYTQTQTVYCIPAAQLVSGAATCAAAGRKRREIALIHDMVEEAKRHHKNIEEKEQFLRFVIAPNPVEKYNRNFPIA